MDNFDTASPPRVVDYGEESFRVVTGNTSANVAKDGKICRQDYALRSGTQTMTDLEIMRNYTEGLPSLGFRITNTDRNPDQEIFATINKDGSDYWVHVWPSNGNGLHIMVLQVAAFRSTIVPLAANDCAPVPGLRDFEATRNPPDTRTFEDRGIPRGRGQGGAQRQQDRRDLPSELQLAAGRHRPRPTWRS